MKKVTKQNITEKSRKKQAKLKPPSSKKSLEHGMSKATLFANKQSKALGKVLRAKRIELELSQKEFGSQVGYSQNFIRQFETGHCGLSVTQLIKIADALGMSLSEVFLTTERALKNGAKMRKIEDTIELENGKNGRKRKVDKTPELLHQSRQRSQALAKATRAASKERLAVFESRMFEKQEARDFKRQEELYDASEKKPKLNSAIQNKSDAFLKITDTIKPNDASTIESAIQLLGSRWTASILIEIANGTRRMTRIRSKVHGLSAKMASLRLAQLQRSGLIERKQFREVPPRVEYSLTPDGHRVISLMETTKKLVQKLMV